MSDKRKFLRINSVDLNPKLKNVVIRFSGVNVDAEVENLSRLGICLKARRIEFIKKGDLILISFPDLDLQLSSICIYCEINDDSVDIGAYFMNMLEEDILLN
ncbi:MAG TPA: PilZ domain-containing protein [Spirochaetota bacterium]|nr:PilZ domain-containing protein [Spirochaetota bacterium]